MPEPEPLTDDELDEVQRYYHADSLEARVAADLRKLREAVGPFVQMYQYLKIHGWALAGDEDKMPMSIPTSSGPRPSFGHLRRLVACLSERGE